MKWLFKRQSVFVYFILMSLISILFIGVISCISFFGMRDIYSKLSSIYEQKLNTIKTADDIRKDILYIRYHIAIISAAAKNEDISKEVFEEDKDLKMLIGQFESKYVDDQVSKKLLKALKASLKNYLESFEKTKLYLKMGYPVNEKNKNDLIKYEEKALKLLDDFVNYNTEQADDLIVKSKGIYVNKLIIFILAALISCSLILFILIYLLRTVRNSIREVFNVLSKMAGGYGAFSLTNIQENEFDKIKNALSKTIIRQEDIKQLEALNSELSKALKELKEAQEQLIQKERLVSLGHLVGGIAHNLKTPIMTVSGNIETIRHLTLEYYHSIGDNEVIEADHRQIAEEMLNWINKTKPMLEYIDKIINSIMKQSVVFNGIESKEEFSISDLIENINILMSYEVKISNCVLKIENKTSQDSRIKGQISALVQVINNLIINSVYSYNGSFGEIELKIVKEDTKVVISVRDNGAGIPNDVKEVLFKQMITTKGKDGTGIGLYVSYSTIKAEFSGEMWFESEKGIGTVFYISLPLITKSGMNQFLPNGE